MKAKIVATGSYRPKKKITNYDFEKIMDTSHEWIVQRTGIETRFYEEYSTVNMATEAAKAALSKFDLESIDCIIVGTYTPDSFIPSVANQVKENLRILKPIPSFDVNAACSGFLYALHTANAFIKSDTYQNILVIGVDFNSRYLDFEDRSSAILFGDGAGAVVLSRGTQGIIDSIIGSIDDNDLSLVMKNNTDYANPFFERNLVNDKYFMMKGKDVFKFAIKIFEQSVLDILERNSLTTDDIDYIVAHQANQRILDFATRSLKIEKHKILSNVADVGNTSSGSVPLLLDEKNQEGIFREGMKIILVAFGGGLTYGCTLVEWI